MKKTLMTAATLAAFTLTALPAAAIVGDGNGCGCIQPCWIIKR